MASFCQFVYFIPFSYFPATVANSPRSSLETVSSDKSASEYTQDVTSCELWKFLGRNWVLNLIMLTSAKQETSDWSEARNFNLSPDLSFCWNKCATLSPQTHRSEKRTFNDNFFIRDPIWINLNLVVTTATKNWPRAETMTVLSFPSYLPGRAGVFLTEGFPVLGK